MRYDFLEKPIRSGKNLGGYRGETIDIFRILEDIELAALRHGWQPELFFSSAKERLLAFHLAADPIRQRIYLSSGIHGDEPAGPLAVLELLRAHAWPEGVDIWLCPCLNPSGFELNRRENSAGFDLNRQYYQPQCDEIRSHVAWLGRQPPFDGAISLHEDWESHGFYLYELNPDRRPSGAEKVIEAVEAVCPIDRSPIIDGRPARGGVIRPEDDVLSRPQWAEAIYLVAHKTRHSYTLEAPSDFPLGTRVRALVTAVTVLLRE